MFDMVIRNGTVIDGSGSPGRVTDEAITAGRIAAVDSDLAPDLTGLPEVFTRALSPWDNMFPLGDPIDYEPRPTRDYDTEQELVDWTGIGRRDHH